MIRTQIYTCQVVLRATLCLAFGLFSCSPGAPTPKAAAATSNVDAKDDSVEGKMKVTIGSKTYSAELEDNSTVDKLKALLPLTLEMTDLNNNEKYYHFSDPLPTEAVRPGTIQQGDLMLYGDNSLVLFYKTFKTSYSYTPIGRIRDPSGLAAAVGSGDIPVIFELE